MLQIVYHADYQIALRRDHRFPMSKYGYLRRRLGQMGLMRDGAFFAPAEAGSEMISVAHAPEYVERVFTKSLSAGEIRRIGLPMSTRLVRRVRLSCAGTTLAARVALEHGLALNAAGGSHHAAWAAGAGFCVFNDVAVAASTLLAEGVIGSALVVDLDVHQGDGTARIFAKDPRVFTLSLHGAKNFPARKAKSDLDAPLADGAGDALYLSTLARSLEAVAARRFDVVFYNAGVDVAAADRLGRLEISPDGLRRRERLVIEWARRRGTPLVVVMGGGYGADPDEVAARHAVVFEEAFDVSGGMRWAFSTGSARCSAPPKPRIRALSRRRSRFPR